MLCVMRPTTTCVAVLGLTLAGLGICATSAARAADVAPPVYGPAPYPAPNYGAGYGGPCRIVLDRRIDPYGREIVQRMRVCDEGAMYPPVAPGYGDPLVYYGPGYFAYPPRPPGPIWPGYANWGY